MKPMDKMTAAIRKARLRLGWEIWYLGNFKVLRLLNNKRLVYY